MTMSHAMKKVTTPMSAPVKRALEAFDVYVRKHDDYGTCDTEPGWMFHSIIRRALDGEPFPTRINWEIYSYDNYGGDYEGTDSKGVPYSVKRKRSKDISAAMTNKARRVYDAIIKGPMSNREALKQYAWRCY
jgi:hypothetical protein